MSNELSSMKYLEDLQMDAAAPAVENAAKDPAEVAAECLIPPSDKQRIKVAVFCLVLGILGSISCLYKISSYAMNHSEKFRAEAVRKMDSQQKKIFRASYQTIEKYDPFILFEMVAHGCISAALIFGGFFAFANRSTSSGFLATVCVCAIVYVTARLLFTGWLSIETMAAIKDVMSVGSRSAAVNAGMQIGMFIGFGFSVLWSAGVIGFYFYAVSVLRKYQDFVDDQLKLFKAQPTQTAAPA